MKPVIYALISLLCVSAPFIRAQPAVRATESGADAVVPVRLGESVVALAGPWKFHVGDDRRWADRSFDDSQWETVDLLPNRDTTRPGAPDPAFVTGWTERGHANYAGFAWYRLHVRLSEVRTPLTLLSPEWFDGGFQVFVNGRLAGYFGDFSTQTPKLYYPHPVMFSVSPSGFASGSDGIVLLAFRFYMPPDGLLQAGSGGMHSPPILSLPPAAGGVSELEWEKVYRRTASAFAAGLLYLVFDLLAAMMLAFNRKDRILLWPLSACMLTVIHVALVVSTNMQWTSAVYIDALMGFSDKSSWGLWLLTWWAYFDLQANRWLFKTILALGILNMACTEFFTFVLWTTKASHGFLAAKTVSDFALGYADLFLIAAIVLLGWRRREPGQWSLYLAVFFYAVPSLRPEITLLHLRTIWFPFGVLIPLGLITACCTLFFFSIYLFKQFRTSLQRKQAMEEDVEQALQVQQLLIPDQLPDSHGWSIETEYRPARQVGGDFFQIIPHRSDGSILIVVGDVTGKGLQAGMTVALLVGVIRTESEHTFIPIEILKQLNSRLVGREGAQATCLALLIRETGEATLANAGHIPPYLNGDDLRIEGSLPLGTIAHAEFSTLEFKLQPDDQLVLISDGVVEAQNARGDLLGFDRIRTLVSKRASAVEIADTAQAYGQQDDISVLSIRRTPMSEEMDPQFGAVIEEPEARLI